MFSGLLGRRASSCLLGRRRPACSVLRNRLQIEAPPLWRRLLGREVASCFPLGGCFCIEPMSGTAFPARLGGRGAWSKTLVFEAGALLYGAVLCCSPLIPSEFKQVNVHKFQSLLNTDIIRKSPFPSRMFSCLYSYMPVHFLKERKKKKVEHRVGSENLLALDGFDFLILSGFA